MTAPTGQGRRLLLIITGGIAAYKSLELIRRARERKYNVRAVMTNAATQFITPLSVGAITGDRVFVDMFDRNDEHDVGHIRLSRESDLIVVAPASADFMAKMACGLADDLASAVVLATDKPVLIAPAMNPRMWLHPATKRNLAQLQSDGVLVVGPDDGEMAESGEAGPGRLADPDAILARIDSMFASEPKGPLNGRRVLITAGPTHEPIDPVRYIANRSSGKQGFAIAEAARTAGADVVLITGPVSLPNPAGVTVVRVETASDMRAAVEDALPADVGIFAAAVADWRVERAGTQKIKKQKGLTTPVLNLVENPDILYEIANHNKKRPGLVVGFAAETENVVATAKQKRQRKGCDWIVANDVSEQSGVMGGDENSVHLISADATESWPQMSKSDVAKRLIEAIAQTLRKRAGKRA